MIIRPRSRLKKKTPCKKAAALLFAPLFALALAIFASCSSVPKRPAEIFLLYNMTVKQLQLVDSAAGRGNYAEALDLLTEARRLALSTDRPSLRIRVNLSRGNVLFYSGKSAEAGIAWKEAEDEALTEKENVLASAARLYQLRAAITKGGADTAEIRARAQAELAEVKADKQWTALAWTVTGLAEKELGLFDAAEKSIRNSLSIHENGRYLEQAAYDWYLIASVRSVAGNYEEAQAALDSALALDRRAENSFALALDWAAKGEVYGKMGKKTEAAAALSRAAAIFRSIEQDAKAAELEKRLLQGR